MGLPLLLATLLSLYSPSAAVAAKNPDDWKGFNQDRPKLIEDLSVAFVSCFKRHDSAIDPLSPIFHGCLDWHSAVHAAYSHHVAYRRTGDENFLTLINDQFAPQGVSLVPAEEVYEQAKAPDFPLTENPYGFGWFLVLAKERELATGEKDLRPMADFAAEQMTAWFSERLTSGDAYTYITNTAHPNYSWSLINLDVWARYTNDKDLQRVVHEATEPLFSELIDGQCDLDVELLPNRTGFQSPCLMRLAALAHIWGDKAKSFITKRLPKDLHIATVTQPANCHAGGLNFTRAFALWQLYQLTGDTRMRENYAELIRYHTAHPEFYVGEMYAGNPDYMCYSHWVAQVGVRAISLSYEPRPPTPRDGP